MGLVDNHLHLVVATPQANLGPGMRRLLSGYAQSFNRRHGCSGHLFGERYHAERITSDSHLLETCAYVVLNPVRDALRTSLMPRVRPRSVGLGKGGPDLSDRAEELLEGFGES